MHDACTQPAACGRYAAAAAMKDDAPPPIGLEEEEGEGGGEASSAAMSLVPSSLQKGKGCVRGCSV